MSTAFIVDQNANRILFSSVKLRGYQSFKVCGDILADTTVRPELVCKLKHGLRSYLGVSLRLEVGRSATLIVVSPSPRVFSSNDIALACELCACIEDRYQMRNEAHIANTVSNLSITSTLLSGIKVHLRATRMPNASAWRDVPLSFLTIPSQLCVGLCADALGGGYCMPGGHGRCLPWTLHPAGERGRPCDWRSQEWSQLAGTA